MISKELWINDNWMVFKKQEEDEMREKLAQNTRHKQYRCVQLHDYHIRSHDIM